MAQHTDETAPYDDNDPAFHLHVGGKLETRSTVPSVRSKMARSPESAYALRLLTPAKAG